MKYYEMTFEDLRTIGYEGPPVNSGLRFLGKGVEKINDIHKADAIIIPLSTRETNELTPQLWCKINEYYKTIDERRFVTFDCSDFEFQTDKYKNGTFIRCNLKGWMKRQMPHSIAWSWPVENFKDCVTVPQDGFKYKIGFRGWISSNVRKSSTDSCLKTFGENMDFYGTNEFYGYIERDRPEDAKVRKELFKSSLKNCLVQLTPCSIWNVFPYRMYEAMSAGRVPMLFCHDYCLPFTDKIDWDKCIVKFDVQQAPDAGPLIQEWLSHHTENEIIEMGRYGRNMWETWLNRDRYPELMTQAVEELFLKEGLIK